MIDRLVLQVVGNSVESSGIIYAARGFGVTAPRQRLKPLMFANTAARSTRAAMEFSDAPRRTVADSNGIPARKVMRNAVDRRSNEEAKHVLLFGVIGPYSDVPTKLTDARHPPLHIRLTDARKIGAGFANERTVREDRHILSLAGIQHHPRSVMTRGQTNRC
jgi:hypothetical protein